MIIKVVKKDSGEENLDELPFSLSDFEQWKEHEDVNKLLEKEEINKLLDVLLKEINEKVNKKKSGKEKSYEIPVIRLSDFEQWKDVTEINKPLIELLKEILGLTLTEDALEETFVNPIKPMLPRNTLNNLYRDNDEEKLNNTIFTKHRKELLLKVVREIIAEFKPTDNYEVKITS